MQSSSRNRRWLLIAALVSMVIPMLACGTGGLATQRAARWACPSPTPLPFGESGPVKREWQECTTDPLTGERRCETRREYYTEWEQEYGAEFSGPPFPSPTPYAIKGTTFLLGQRVEVGQFHVTVSASTRAVVDRPGVPAGTQQLFFVNITWLSHADAPVPISYAERVRLRSVREPSGAVITGDSWAVTAESLQLAELARLPDRIPTGESSVRVPIIGPVGEPVTVEIVFDGGAPPVAGSPTPTPLPNDDLRRQEPDTLTVQWTEGSLRDIGPSCDDVGVITPWGDGRYISWGRDVEIGMAAPPGADRLIQVALNQVGKPYVWGAKGPETFDCSGLASWSYGQIGIRIPQGTAGQWPQMRAVETRDLKAGDLVFFDIEGLGQIDHVGILLGDLNGDGRWDMEHAASPQLGVRIDYGIFESAYYAPRVRGFRTAR